jgi:ABC-type lipoprotein release transport system permease subunit
MIDALALLLPLAWRSLWRNPRRTVITLLVVAAGLYSILCFAALLQAWADSSRDSALNLMTGSAQIHAAGYLDDPTVARRIPAPAGRLLAALGGREVAAWAPRVRVPAVVRSEYKTLPLTFAGVEPQRERGVSTIPAAIAEGRYLSGEADAGIVLGRHMAERLRTRVGKRVIVMAQAADGSLEERSFDVVGLFAGNREAEDGFAFTGIAAARSMLGIGADVSEIAISVPDDRALDGVVASLRSAAPALDVRPWTALAPMAAAMSDFVNAFVYIWLWIMFVLMAIGIVNTQLMAVFERVREFGLLRALGMAPRLILAEVALESAILVGVGVAAGMAGAAATIAALHGGVDLSFLARGAEYFGAGHVFHPSLSPSRFVALSAVIWAVGTAVALWPARKAARSSPTEAMSHVT